MHSRVGELLPGGVRLVAALGNEHPAAGGAAVYQGLQESLQRPVAVRLRRVPPLSPAESLQLRAVAGLDDPHLAQLHDFGRQGDWTYSVSEWVEGISLRRLISGLAPREPHPAVAVEGLPLPPGQSQLVLPQLLEIAQQVVLGLAAAHRRGVAHGSLRPGQVLVSWNERGEPRVKLVGCGLGELGRGARAFGDGAARDRRHLAAVLHYACSALGGVQLDWLPEEEADPWLERNAPLPPLRHGPRLPAEAARTLGRLLGRCLSGELLPLASIVEHLRQVDARSGPAGASESIAEAELAAELGWRPEPGAEVDPLARLVRDGPLRAELAAAVLAATRQRQPLTLLVRGHIGSGRSALFRGLLEQLGAERRLLLAAAECRRDAAMGGVIGQSLRRLLGLPAGPLPATRVHRALSVIEGLDPSERAGCAALIDGRWPAGAEGLLERLVRRVARHRPLVLAVEDLERGPPALMQMIGRLHLSLSLRPAPVVLVLSAQHEGLVGQPAVATELADLVLSGASAAESYELASLPLERVLVALVEGYGLAPALAERLAGLTGGNPFHLRHVLAALEGLGLEPGPEGRDLPAGCDLEGCLGPRAVTVTLRAVRDALASQRAPEAALALLQDAALLGPRFREEQLQRLRGAPISGLSALIASGLLNRAPGQVIGFPRPLLRQALVAAPLGRPERCRAAAEVIAGRPLDAAQRWLLPRLWERARRPGKALRGWLDLAAEAEAGHRYDDLAEACAPALSLMGPSPELFLAAARAALARGRSANARRWVEAAARAPGPQQHLAQQLSRSLDLRMGAQPRTAPSAARSGLAQGLGALGQGRLQEAQEVLDRTRHGAASQLDPLVVFEVGIAQARARLRAGQREEAAQLERELRLLASRRQSRVATHLVASLTALLAEIEGDLKASVAAWLSTAGYFRAIGWPAWTGHALLGWSRCARRDGDRAQSLRAAGEARALLRAGGDALAIARADAELGRARLLAREEERGVRALRRAFARLEAHDQAEATSVAAALAVHLLEQQRVQAAAPWLARCRLTPPETFHDLDLGLDLMRCSELLLERDPVRARSLGSRAILLLRGLGDEQRALRLRRALLTPPRTPR